MTTNPPKKNDNNRLHVVYVAQKNNIFTETTQKSSAIVMF